MRPTQRTVALLAALICSAAVPSVAQAAWLEVGPGFPKIDAGASNDTFYDPAKPTYVPGDVIEQRVLVNYTGSQNDPANAIVNPQLVIDSPRYFIGLEGLTPTIVSAGGSTLTPGACKATEIDQFLTDELVCPLTGTIPMDSGPVVIGFSARTTTDNIWGTNPASLGYTLRYDDPLEPGTTRMQNPIKWGGPMPSKRGSNLVARGGYAIPWDDNGTPKIQYWLDGAMATDFWDTHEGAYRPGDAVPYKLEFANTGTSNDRFPIVETPAIKPTLEARFPTASFAAFDASAVKLTGIEGKCSVTVVEADRVIRCETSADLVANTSAMLSLSAKPLVAGQLRVDWRATQPGRSSGAAWVSTYAFSNVSSDPRTTTPAATPTPTPTATPTAEPEATPVVRVTPTPVATPTPSPESTLAPTTAATPTPAPNPEASPSATPAPTAAPSPAQTPASQAPSTTCPTGQVGTPPTCRPQTTQERAQAQLAESIGGKTTPKVAPLPKLTLGGTVAAFRIVGKQPAPTGKKGGSIAVLSLSCASGCTVTAKMVLTTIGHGQAAGRRQALARRAAAGDPKTGQSSGRRSWSPVTKKLVVAPGGGKVLELALTPAQVTAVARGGATVAVTLTDRSAKKTRIQSATVPVALAAADRS